MCLSFQSRPDTIRVVGSYLCSYVLFFRVARFSSPTKHNVFQIYPRTGNSGNSELCFIYFLGLTIMSFFVVKFPLAGLRAQLELFLRC